MGKLAKHYTQAVQNISCVYIWPQYVPSAIFIAAEIIVDASSETYYGLKHLHAVYYFTYSF